MGFLIFFVISIFLIGAWISGKLSYKLLYSENFHEVLSENIHKEFPSLSATEASVTAEVFGVLLKKRANMLDKFQKKIKKIDEKREAIINKFHGKDREGKLSVQNERREVVWREFMGELAALFKDAWPESQHQLLEEVSDIEIRNKMDSVMEGLSKLMK